MTAFFTSPRAALARLVFVLAGCLLIGCVFWVYERSWDNEALHDDGPYVLDNPVLEGFSRAYVEGRWVELIDDYRRRALVGDVTNNMLVRPLAYASFEWSQRVGSREVTAYRQFNTVVHSLNGLMFWGLLVLLGTSVPLAWLVALVAVLHPLASASVAQLVQRFEILMTLFGLMALGAWVLAGRQTEGKGIRACFLRLISGLLMVAAMLCKESGALLPLVAVGIELGYFQQTWRAALRRCSGLLALLALVPLLMWLSARAHGLSTVGVNDWATVAALDLSSLLPHLAIQPWCLARYLQLLILPVGQNFHHAIELCRDMTDWRLWAGFSLLALCLAGVLRVQRGLPEARRFILLLGGAWFLLGMAVTSLAPLPDAFAEHRTYFASFGLLMAVSACFSVEVLRPRAVILGLLVPAVLAFGSVRRCEVMHSGQSLWADCLAGGSRSPRVFKGLGIAAVKSRHWSEAIDYFERATQANPEDWESWYNLLNTLLVRSEYERGRQVSLQALMRFPEDPVFQALRVQVLIGLKEYELAGHMLEALVKRCPDDHRAKVHLARIRAWQGRPAEALKWIKAAGADANVPADVIQMRARLISELVVR